MMQTIESELPYALLFYTGSKKFNIIMRGIAKKKGYLLNEHSLYDINMKPYSAKSEKDIFDKLGMNYHEPSERNK
jgi:DNA polymerase/3'-5' exonuclease PolX